MKSLKIYLKRSLNVPVLLLLLVVLSWASATVVTKHLYLEKLATPFTLTAIRFTLAGSVALLLLAGGQRFYYRNLPPPSAPRSANDFMYLPLGQRWRAHLLGGALIAMFIFGFNAALLYISATLGGIIFFGLTPVTILLGGRWWLGTKLGRRQIGGIAIALLGMVIVLTGGDLDRFMASLKGSNLGLGIALMIFAAVGWGGYSLWGKWYASANPQGSLLSTGLNQLIGVVPIWLLVLLAEPGQIGQLGLQAWLLILYIGVVPSAIGFALYYALLSHLTLSQAATIQLFSPVFTTILAVCFVGEPLSLALIIGTLVLLWGVRRSQQIK